MAYIYLFLAMVVFGAYGYWRGGLRFGLGLLPLVIASLLLWLLGGIFYRLEFLSNLGLMWPGLILIILGLAIGYTTRFLVNKKIPKEKKQYDRIIGSVIGVLVAMVMTWLATVYVWLYATSRQQEVSLTTSGLAKTLNKGVVQWIPGLSSSSETMMMFVEIASADENVQQLVIEDLELDQLYNLPELQDVINDAGIVDNIESLQTGNIIALLKLQKNPLIIKLIESDDVQEAISRLSLEEIVNAIQKAEDKLDKSDADK